MHSPSLRRPAAVAAATVAVLTLSLVAPTAASAAAPAAATLISPADGATTASVTPTLSVTATDPDGGSLDVRFEGRVAGATVPGDSEAEPFTFVVVPDTQNYSDGRQALLEQQLRWVRDSRAELGTAFVAQVGDLVGDWFIPRQWNNVSTAFEILDDAAVPNTVLPGNHDLDASSGDVAAYNTHFGPSRYAQAGWNTASTRYGGHLGQNQFGPDGIDRGNADSYALFSAGGRDFLLLNLEWEAPAYALEWADRVLDAHPDRTVIMATHSFLTVNGTRLTTPQRPGGTSPASLWQDFVRTHCQIRLVVAGHENQGDLGEARRTDDNACGQPVHQILSNYQARANGGDGWLRYYTFDPAENTMAATTYSPVLDRFETDASSAFTLPFELSTPQPAPFQPIATRTVGSGSTAQAEWTGLAPDEEYEWRAVVDDGTTSTPSGAWRLRTPAPPVQALASDAFSRTVANGWGTAEVGGAWSVSGGSSAFSVGGGRGVVTLAPSHTREARLPAVSARDVIVDVQVGTDVASVGGTASATVIGRLVGSSSYALSLRFQPGGVLVVYLLRDNIALDSAVSSWAPGQRFQARLSVTGTSPTQLAAKVWPQSAAEPTAWQLTASDSTAVLQTAGIVSVRSAVSSSSAVSTTRLSYDELRVTAPGAPPANAPPSAAFTTGGSGLTVTIDGRGSSDADGTITAYAWQLGDGSTATGPTASRTYAAAGSYTIRLTVTDDDGATATTTRVVTATAPPPENQAPTAAIAAPVVDGRSVQLDGSDSSDPDGTIAGYTWAFGDGQSGTGATPSHVFDADGTFTVRLTVTDDDGATGTVTRTVTVAATPPHNQSPTAQIATPEVEGRAVSLDGRGSSDADGTIVAYAWQFGDGQSGTGPTPSHVFDADGTYSVRLTVTDDDGATGTVTRTVTVAGPSPGGEVIAADDFERSVTNGWGTAGTGGGWSATGGSTAYSVSGGDGIVALRAGDTREARLNGVSTTSAEVSVRISTETAPAGGTTSATVIGRLVGSAAYSARLRLEPSGALRLYLLRDQTLLDSYQLPGAYLAGEEILLRLRVHGTAPTTLAARIWRAGTTEPSAWQVQATDGTAALQHAGSLTLHSYISGASTVPVTRVHYDDYRVTTGG
ncbi:PKD domain-containing protein [Agrococcus baldri]|uniref:PKD domain-containing protein n=1 Tax=Agrococcus baldri TaxID=153730 RepID=A0AA87R950_9MICO|nr:PKD domain-containing protein [Agrococcus baldri]GEK78845.1 hypothetical protein ABA31_01960 [Agrococcus baldri]